MGEDTRMFESDFPSPPEGMEGLSREMWMRYHVFRNTDFILEALAEGGCTRLEIDELFERELGRSDGIYLDESLALLAGSSLVEQDGDTYRSTLDPKAYEQMKEFSK